MFVINLKGIKEGSVVRIMVHKERGTNDNLKLGMTKAI